MASITSLPPEILVEVMTNLDPSSLVRCALTCRLLHDTYMNSSKLQYMLELSMNEIRDAGTDAPFPDRLARIRELRVNWSDMKCVNYKTVNLDISFHLSNEFVAGVLAFTEGQSFKAVWLPSTRDAGRTIKHDTHETPFQNFTIDPIQDLLVFLEREPQDAPLLSTTRLCRVHLRTLSSNDFHQEAKQPVLTFTLPADPDGRQVIRQAVLHLASDVLGLFLVPWRISPILLIWNWRNGDLIYDSRGDDLAYSISDFVLLNPTSFILASFRDNGSILLYNLSEATYPAIPATLVAIFHLPILKPFQYVSRISIHMGAFQDKPAPGELFYTVPESRMLVFAISYAGLDVPHDSGHSYQLFVHMSSFLKHLPESSVDRPPLDIFWDAWGEQETRFLQCREPMLWSRYVHGSRVVRIIPSKFVGRIEILDFNMARAHASDNPKGLPDHYIQTEPSYISSNIFESQVITRRPYRSSTLEVGEASLCYLIDEERLVAVQIDSHNYLIVDKIDVDWF